MTSDNLFTRFAKGEKKISAITNDCVIYTRVSSSKQMDNLSLETQLKGTNEHAKRFKLITREHFGGTYESAQTDERKEFQRMIRYIKTSRYKISKILVYSLERFSRNDNSIWLSGQLRKLGVEIVSVTQPIDTSNPAGQMQQKMLFIFGEFDNQLRRQKCMAGMKERLLKGEWVCQPPIGYDIIRVNNERKIVVNELGKKIIKKIFLWKAQDRLTNVEIQKRLLALNVKYNLRKIGDILTNPFYCGMLAHKALEGKVIDGTHEKLITKEIFLTVNNLLQAKKLGLQTKKESATIALKRFMKCESCHQPMRGYVVSKWGVAYYKCNTPGCKCNRNADDVNVKFLNLLADFTVNTEYKELIKYEVTSTFKQMNSSIEENQFATKVKITDLNKRIERLEERYVLEEITGELYAKFKAKFEKERDDLEGEIHKTAIEMSKLDGFLDYTLNIAAHLPKMWEQGNYMQRQLLQYMVFPEGITYNRQEDECRSGRVNSFMAHLACVSKTCANFVPCTTQNSSCASVCSLRAESRSDDKHSVNESPVYILCIYP
jgi:DNA invertase Pin-like site-specific DNA recombinase